MKVESEHKQTNEISEETPNLNETSEEKINTSNLSDLEEIYNKKINSSENTESKFALVLLLGDIDKNPSKNNFAEFIKMSIM